MKKSIVGNKVKIGSGCKIANSIILDEVVIKDGTSILNTVICKAAGNVSHIKLLMVDVVTLVYLSLCYDFHSLSSHRLSYMTRTLSVIGSKVSMKDCRVGMGYQAVDGSDFKGETLVSDMDPDTMM